MTKHIEFWHNILRKPRKGKVAERQRRKARGPKTRQGNGSQLPKGDIIDRTSSSTLENIK